MIPLVCKGGALVVLDDADVQQIIESALYNVEPRAQVVYRALQFGEGVAGPFRACQV